MVSFTRKHAGDRIRPDDINEIQVAVEGMPDPGQVAEIEAVTQPISALPTGGRIRREYGATVLSVAAAPEVNIRDYASLVDLDGYWNAAVIQALQDGYTVVFPESSDLPDGAYKINEWIPMVSHRRLVGVGAASVIYNDKTNSDSQRRACFLPGLHHPTILDDQTPYTLDAIDAGDYAVTCSISSEADSFDADELVIVGSATAISGVPRHAQLNKISSISSGTITLVDPIVESISDARIWKITGTDSSSGYDVYAVEDLTIENLGFKGRSALATKGAVFHGTFRNLHMLDTHIFFATNMLTHVLAENLTGQWSGRYLEFAMNSYHVTARNWDGQYRPPAGLQSGESMVFPIHLGERPHTITLDQIVCHVDDRHSTTDPLAQIKGSNITIRRSNWRNAGASGSIGVQIPDSPYAGFPYRNIVFEDCILAAPGKGRVVDIGSGSVTDEMPDGVHFRGGELRESVTSEAIWFRGGRNLSCSMDNRTGTAIKVSGGAQYPNLTGYRGLS